MSSLPLDTRASDPRMFPEILRIRPRDRLILFCSCPETSPSPVQQNSKMVPCCAKFLADLVFIRFLKKDQVENQLIFER